MKMIEVKKRSNKCVPKNGQNESKNGQRGPKISQKTPKKDPKKVEKRPKMSQKQPKRTQKESKSAKKEFRTAKNKVDITTFYVFITCKGFTIFDQSELNNIRFSNFSETCQTSP